MAMNLNHWNVNVCFFTNAQQKMLSTCQQIISEFYSIFLFDLGVSISTLKSFNQLMHAIFSPESNVRVHKFVATGQNQNHHQFCQHLDPRHPTIPIKSLFMDYVKTENWNANVRRFIYAQQKTLSNYQRIIIKSNLQTMLNLHFHRISTLKHGT